MYAKFGCCTMLPNSVFSFPNRSGIRIYDNGLHDADEVQLFHGVVGDGCRELNRELYKL